MWYYGKVLIIECVDLTREIKRIEQKYKENLHLKTKIYGGIKMKKKAAIVFGITENYEFALANVLIGMKKHCDKFWDDIIVFHDDLSIEKQQRLNKILPCQFRKLDFSKFQSKANSESVKAYSFLSMARFECFSMLADYEYIIWHDVDILIQSDFAELLHSADKTGFALTYDTNFCMEQNFWQLEKISYKLLKPLYNSGIMVLKDTLKHFDELTNYCYSQYNKYGETLRYLDQAILNIMIQDYNIEVGYISLEEYCCHPSRKAYPNAKIIHAYGSDKFWNSDERIIQFPEWKENNDIWQRYYCNEDKLDEAMDHQVCTVVYLNSKEKKYELAAFKSLLYQYANGEVHIIVEYGEEQIVQELKKLASDRKIYFHENKAKIGFEQLLASILDTSDMDYIVISDGKTYSMPRRYEKQMKYLEQHEEVSAVGGYFWQKGQLSERPIGEKKLEILSLLEKPIYAETAMYRKEALKQLMMLGLKYDSYVFWNVLTEKYKVQNIPEKMAIDDFENNIQNQRTSRPDDIHVLEVQEILEKQFRIDISYDEAILLLCPEIVYKCYHTSYFKKRRREVIARILTANKECCKYDCVELHQLLYGESEEDSNKGQQLKEIMRNAQGKKIALWGTGRRCIKYLMEYPDFNVDVCIDNDISKKQTQVNHIDIIHPSDIKKWEEYYIVITPVKCQEIKKQLELYGLKYIVNFAYGDDVF